MPTTAEVICGTGTNIADAFFTDWTNPGNIVNNNAVDATCVAGASGSDDLRASNFVGFNIPADSVIVGVRIMIEASEHSTGTEALTVYLATDSGRIGSSKSATISGTTKVVYTLGSATDLWGLSQTDLTPAVVNATGFGSRCFFSTAHDVRIDYISCIIDYASPPHVAIARRLA